MNYDHEYYPDPDYYKRLEGKDLRYYSTSQLQTEIDRRKRDEAESKAAATLGITLGLYRKVKATVLAEERQKS